MGITSSVAVALKAELVEKMPESVKWLFDDADTIYKSDQGVLFHFDSIKWYSGDEGISALYEFVYGFDIEDYKIEVGCHDYPSLEDDQDCGSWDGFNVYKSISISVEFDDTQGEQIK